MAAGPRRSCFAAIRATEAGAANLLYGPRDLRRKKPRSAANSQQADEVSPHFCCRAAMESTENAAPLRIANSHSICTLIRGWAGLSYLALFPLAIARFLGGDWRGLGFLVLPPAALVIARLLEHVTPQHVVTLYSNKLEISRFAKPARVVRWSDVSSLRWPRSRNPDSESAPVRLALRNDSARSANQAAADQAEIDLAAVSPEDRLILIKYLRRAGAAVEHEHWGDFCRKQAVPLAERLEGRDATPRWIRSIDSYPFLAGLLAPIAVAYLLPKAVSRTTWWNLAAIIAASAWINIRMVWGNWASPFSEICLGAAAVCFLFGVFAAPDRPSKADRIASPLAMIAWYVPALIACPFVAVAASAGWIPRQFGPWAGIAGLIMLLGPALQSMWSSPRQRRRREKLREALQADALHRWAVYQATGSLPPPAPEEAPE